MPDAQQPKGSALTIQCSVCHRLVDPCPPGTATRPDHSGRNRPARVGFDVRQAEDQLDGLVEAYRPAKRGRGRFWSPSRASCARPLAVRGTCSVASRPPRRLRAPAGATEEPEAVEYFAEKEWVRVTHLPSNTQRHYVAGRGRSWTPCVTTGPYGPRHRRAGQAAMGIAWTVTAAFREE